MKQLIATAQNENRNLLLNEAVEVLESYGITTTRALTATNAQNARKAADMLGYPVAMKIISQQISHKSDVGGVQLNLRDGSAVTEAFRDMVARIEKAYADVVFDGVMVQAMAAGGRELIIGGMQDKQFGPVLMVGHGGIFVEIIEQATMRIAPIPKNEAYAMLDELSGSQILKGVRGQKPFDIDAIVETLLRVSQLLLDFPEIKELDINPLRIFYKGQGCAALDARIIL